MKDDPPGCVALQHVYFNILHSHACHGPFYLSKPFPLGDIGDTPYPEEGDDRLGAAPVMKRHAPRGHSFMITPPHDKDNRHDPRSQGH
ncbi:hypothetical protein IFJ82_10245 [Novacetimonas hansenii]|uniref:Uncharacterized protein n=2 Tax=Novacetimonas hansenii TaxID=436 RepID=A0AAW5EYD3_NOVHA|nr:hypothetical protein [Novacetimonas hansenii]MBL7236171.1 hypothetical protein [Novacetimonas hansenii]MCJ8355255.1 hypothetical protein [Novacetimonas hansenii]QOF94317.1 hypothetical protein IFJ82_10245 [Novacetimonas hansenii]GAN84550.1 hypothetical protein Gaha_0188_018 [Novacetimonas hansenii JCM 7643]GBQ52808.1 hypothetical protein AA0243_0151 [Novacetimonas hansenii NRIC 0243]